MGVSPENLKATIKAEASNLGFVVMGVAKPQTPPHFQHYLNYIHENRQAGMQYLARSDALEKRQDVDKLLPGCRSVISLLMPYANPLVDTGCGSATNDFCVAAFARQEDYHNRITQKLRQLVAAISDMVEERAEFRCMVDAAPVMERDYASLAGVGWIGKHCQLISAQYGSFVFLAEVLTTLMLEADPPNLDDMCGTCDLCVQACPTGALQPGRVFDARLCISYLTIEYKGIIPLELRSKMGRKIFGCDQCQLVCPYNACTQNQHVSLPGSSTGDVPELDFYTLLRLTNTEFVEQYAKTPFKRTGREAILRNYLIACHNLQKTLDLAVFQQIMRVEASPVLRATAFWLLGCQMTNQPAHQELFKKWAQQDDDTLLQQEFLAIKSRKQ